MRLVDFYGVRQMRISYDHEYGIEQRSGWSVALDGAVVVQFCPSLLRALWRAKTFRLTTHGLDVR
jgi:hypothetical protein